MQRSENYNFYLPEGSDEMLIEQISDNFADLDSLIFNINAVLQLIAKVVKISRYTPKAICVRPPALTINTDINTDNNTYTSEAHIKISEIKSAIDLYKDGIRQSDTVIQGNDLYFPEIHTWPNRTAPYTAYLVGIYNHFDNTCSFELRNTRPNPSYNSDGTVWTFPVAQYTLGTDSYVDPDINLIDYIDPATSTAEYAFDDEDTSGTTATITARSPVIFTSFVEKQIER